MEIVVDMRDENLIFVVSLPRSGSTMLQAILSNNDAVNTTSEPWLLLPYLYPLDEEHNDISKYDEVRAYNALQEFYPKIGGVEHFTGQLRDFLLKLYQPLLTDDSVRYVIDKTPRYYEILPQILEVFPNAKIIVLKRNPVHVLRSIIKTFNITTIKRLLLVKNDILRAPFLLQEFIDKNKDNNNVVSIKYEDLVADPSKHASAIYQWLGIPYVDDNLDFSENSKIKGGFGDPVGVKKYKKPTVIDKSDVRFNSFFERFIGSYPAYLGKEFLSNYGYEISGINHINQQFRYYIFLARENDFSNITVFIKRKFYALRFFYVEEILWLRKMVKKYVAEDNMIGKAVNKIYSWYFRRGE